MSLALATLLAIGLGQLFGGKASGVSTVLVSVIALGALIFIHELGHFLVAKTVGVGVERFSLGFGPRLWSLRRGETEYCISAVPLGGYVKMVGEEAYGEEAIHPEAETPGGAPGDPSKSFVRKPLWARSLIVFAGPGMNFVLAAVIISAIFSTVGLPVFPTTVGRVLPDSAAAGAGLEPGDQVVAVNGRAIRHWGQLEEAVAQSDGRPLVLTVVREGRRQDVTATPRRTPGRTPFGEATEVWSLGTSPYLPPVVGETIAGMPAAEAGLRPRDRIVAINGQPIRTWDEMAEIISKRAGEPVTLTVDRSGGRVEVKVTPRSTTEKDVLGHETEVARIGITQSSPQTYLRLDPASAIARGVQWTWDVTLLTLVSFWKLVTGVIPASNIGGPLQIGVAAGQAAQEGFVPYARLVAVISVNLAILNLLPVPMLDGGHILFFAIEGVLGRPLSVRKREIAQQIGLALLLMLMVFALGNDIWKFVPVGRLFK